MITVGRSTGFCGGSGLVPRGGDLPERYGNWKSVYDRHRRWSRDGTWQRIAEALRVDAETGESVETTTAGRDSSSVHAHHHAAGVPHQALAEHSQKGGSLTRVDRDGREALGRSRGGLTTKIHLARGPAVPSDRDGDQPGTARRLGHGHRDTGHDPIPGIRARQAAHPPSIPRPTHSATLPNAASISSSNTAPWPPGMTNATTCIKAPWA